MNKLIPILFNAPMVRAILTNQKTKTRRTKKLERISSMATEILPSNSWPKQGNWAARFQLPGNPERYEVTNVIRCPYGEVGDILWVRETFISGYEMEDGVFIYDESGEMIPKTWYRADNDHIDWYDGSSDWPCENVPWKPSIHMPLLAARIFLRITDIKVERLLQISDDDALYEGIEVKKTQLGITYRDYETGYCNGLFTPKRSFQSLWQSINGVCSWKDNPWVWVISFERCDKPSINNQ